MLVHRPITARVAFTLMEMLVVIAIIGILAALITGAVFMAMGSQQGSNTETGIRTIQKVFEQQWRAVLDKADKEDVPAGVLTLAGGSPKRARVIWKKLRLKQEFPMSYDEAKQPSFGGGVYVSAVDLPAKKVYLTAIGSRSGTGPAINAACLLLSLQQNRGGVVLSTDDIKGLVEDTNTDGILELIDGWRNPMLFYRTPTGNIELEGSNPAQSGTRAGRYRDPIDPDGLLMDRSWNNFPNWNPANSQIRTFEALLHPIHTGTTLPLYQPISNYIVPTLVSAGKDKKYGLNTDMSEDSTGDAKDNIYGFRLRVGAGGVK